MRGSSRQRPRGSVLVVGSGGREHALAWKLSQSPEVEQVIVAPGNDGMPVKWTRWSADLSLGRAECARLAELARAAQVSLAVIGPDNALADGIVDVFTEAGIPTFGPTARAAEIESSKAFAKDVMTHARVPTAHYGVFDRFESAEAFLREEWQRAPGWVVKADGLALGKGVVVAESLQEALDAARELIALSGRLVIEEKLEGHEVSWLALCDGERAALLPPARDHKRIFDGDRGPNTGGMGAISPVPGLAESLGARVLDEVFLPVLREMKRRGAEFRGVLYAGLMVKSDRFQVLEFNARFGDPEAQVILARIDGDLLPWLRASAAGDLSGFPTRVPVRAESAVVVVGAAPGYPAKVEKGASLEALEALLKESSQVPAAFVAGAARDERGVLRVSGGRVFGALGVASDLAQAREEAYSNLRRAQFAGMQYRLDIGAGSGGGAR